MIGVTESIFGVCVFDRSMDRSIYRHEQVSYAEQAVQRGSLAVAASNGRDAIVMCIERPARDEPAAEGHGDVAEARWLHLYVYACLTERTKDA